MKIGQLAQDSHLAPNKRICLVTDSIFLRDLGNADAKTIAPKSQARLNEIREIARIRYLPQKERYGGYLIRYFEADSPTISHLKIHENRVSKFDRN